MEKYVFLRNIQRSEGKEKVMGKWEEVVNEKSHIRFDLVEEEESRWKKIQPHISKWKFSYTKKDIHLN